MGRQVMLLGLIGALALAGCGGGAPAPNVQHDWEQRTGADWAAYEKGLENGWAAGCTRASDKLAAEADPSIPATAIPTPNCHAPRREFKSFAGPLSAAESLAQTALHVQIPDRPPADPESAGRKDGERAGCLAAFDAWAGIDGIADEGIDRCPL